MAKYTKKPQVVDAAQWTGENMDVIEKLVGADNAIFDCDGLIIKLQRNSVFVTRGNFIVVSSKDAHPEIISEFNFRRLYSPKRK